MVAVIVVVAFVGVSAILPGGLLLVAIKPGGFGLPVFFLLLGAGIFGWLKKTLVLALVAQCSGWAQGLEKLTRAQVKCWVVTRLDSEFKQQELKLKLVDCRQL